MRHLSVVIASGSEIIAAGLKCMLGACSSFHVESRNVNSAELYDAIRKDSASALFIDANDVDLTKQIPEIRDISKSLQSVIGVYFSALSPATQQLFDATISVYDTSDVIDRVLKNTIHLSESGASPSELTPREKEVVIGIVKGMSNKEIALQINVSVNTVMTHRRNIASKLRIHSPAGLTIYAIVSKLVTLDEIKGHLPSLSDSRIQ